MGNKKEVVIYSNDKEVNTFLKSFFKNNQNYNAKFIRSSNSLKKELSFKKKIVAILTDSPYGLEEIQELKQKYPVIALVSKNITQGIHTIVKSDVECYLISPFHKDDLENKLGVISVGKKWIETLYECGNNHHAVVELATLFSSTLDPHEVLYLIVRKLAEIIKVDRCSILSINSIDPQYANVISTYEDPKITNIRIDLRKYPEIRKVLNSREMIVVKDASKDPLMKEVQDIIKTVGIRSIVVIPVIFYDEIIGTLLLRTSRKKHTFTDKEIKMCLALANASATSLYNAFLYENLNLEKSKLEKFAITDYLTGIYNIRYFYNRIEEEFSRSERYRLPLSCMMFDIDYFKRINDTFGHRVGDIILREFAQLVKMHTRRSDIFARYGGEEFILLLPQTDEKGAFVEAERLRNIIKNHHFDALKKKINITVSIGVACSTNKKIRNYDDLINIADNAMFAAKHAGRDRVVINPS
ncbi:MAG: sensor domain-containing diguanylate cyclase [Nitrospirae bacterium]|jgi:diguanylate cyclase (GGDEF)-like protein|nr:sensor domain-containing diguanylate cyclase [Nitrospirota bacterium]